MGSDNVQSLATPIHSTSVATATDFFATDLSPHAKTGSISLLAIGVSVAAACKVGLMISNGTTEIGPIYFNAGTDLVANALYTFSYPMAAGYTYNLRHDDAGSITVNSCVVNEIIGPDA